MLKARLQRAAELVSAALFALMFCAFMIQIVSRYVFNHPISWSLELCSLSYIWLVFWSSRPAHGASASTSSSICSTRSCRPGGGGSSPSPIPPRMGLIFLAALPASLDYISFMGRRTTLILHIPLDLVYACFGIFMVAVIVNAAFRLKRLFGRSWQQHL